ncbi:MAG: DUF481 domain-containing protein [Bacteroidota bacterium]|nr:DUF481 domain-containing protein [Bacteroidota bacterium]
MKHLMLLLIILLCAPLSYGQFSDSTHYLIYYGTTGVMNKTNTSKSFVITNGARFSIRKQSIALNSSGNCIYGEQQGRRTNNDLTTTLDFNLYKTFKNFYYWGLGNFDKSFSLKVNKRWQAGLGAAYSFIDTEKAFLNLSDGILYESSDVTVHDSTRSRYHTFRNSLRLRYRFVIQQKVVLDGTHFWQPSLQYKDDSIIKSASSLSLMLNRWLNLTTALTYNRVTRTEKENLLLTFGLTVEKYF